MSEDTRDTGIPTRAIHEAYLGMQQAHRQFRQARDTREAAESPAHGDYQDAVLTFYELVRPHLKRKGGMRAFWDGELPEYPDRWWGSVEEAKRYCLEQGTAVWSLQKHVQTSQSSPNADADSVAVADGGGETPAEWHDRLNLGDRQRVVAVETGEVVVWVELRAVMGLRRLDAWETRKRHSREQGAGFMAGETSTNVELEYVAPWKLTQAKRLLAEAADKLNLLSRVDVDHEDGAIVNFDQSRGEGRAEYRDAEYGGTPDI